MTRARLLAIALLVLFFPVTQLWATGPGSAHLKVCNDTSTRIAVAIAVEGGSFFIGYTWDITGWGVVDVGTCMMMYANQYHEPAYLAVVHKDSAGNPVANAVSAVKASDSGVWKRSHEHICGTWTHDPFHYTHSGPTPSADCGSATIGTSPAIAFPAQVFFSPEGDDGEFEGFNGFYTLRVDD